MTKADQSNDALIKAMIQTEADIKKAEQDKVSAEKQIENIKKSSTYKLFGGTSKVSQKQRYVEENAILRDALGKATEELKETKEALNLAKLDDRRMNSIELRDAIREVEQDAGLMSHMERVVEQKKQHDQNYKEALIYIGRLFMNARTEYRQSVYSTLLEGLKIEDIPEFMMREAFKDKPLTLKHATSFRASMNMRIRKSQLVGELPEYALDNKQKAYDFVDLLNVDRPWISDQTYAVDQLSFKAGTVVKPADGAGGRGVYLIYELDDITDMKRSRKLSSISALVESMKLDVEKGWVKGDDWSVESLILANNQEKIPANDIKFYCFYGKVGLILEIERYPELKYCWWTAEGQRVSTGKYDNAPFKGDGVTHQEVEKAEAISKKIPAPFIRIDFLRSESGLVFGEFTPKPGNYDEFNERTDQRLGDLFLEAEGRLERDLMDNSFEAFRNFMI
ncbi:ATP-grasp fold amidoligase family protein [Salinicoccus sesuvii]|uniref:ATP-grasp fold amidoligase family protein n=1 Tax=Salinicoccus sesuvii TaxID=868281 RepID=A0ABV7N696_9STAP